MAGRAEATMERIGHRHRASSERATLRDNNEQLAVYNPQEAAALEEEVARNEAEMKLVKSVMGSVFSLKKPRDVFAGTSSGVKAVAGGVTIGVASLVAQPYIGAKSQGPKGFVKGVGCGMLTCAVSTVVGTAVGSTQILRGVLNTPNAIVQKSRGQVWNSEKRKWEKDWYSLPEEAEEVLHDANGASASSSAAGGGSSDGSKRSRTARKVADTSLYDVLEVTPDATEAEIRKAFYKRSLALHPDKNPDNPEATAMFQAVSDAYRVLGNEERRRLYDEHGKDLASQGLPKIEPAVFFAALFGSHHFEPYVGRLRLAQEVDGDIQALITEITASSGQVDILKVSRAREQMKVVQREREVRCALALRDRLMPVIGLPDGKKSAEWAKWEEAIREDVSKLCKVTCGIEMLYLIGWMYSNRSRQWFAGGIFRSALARVEGRMHMTKTKVGLARQVCRAGMKVKGIAQKVEKKKSASEKAAEENKQTASSNGKKGGSSAKQAEEEDDDDVASGVSSTNVGVGVGFASQSTTAHGGEEHHDDHDAPLLSNGASPPVQTAKMHSDEGQQPGAKAESASGAKARASSGPASQTKGGPSVVVPVGSLVMVHGLKNSAELNDEVGVVVGMAENGRCLVNILETGTLKALKAENLHVMEAPSEVFQDGFTSSDAPGAGGSASRSTSKDDAAGSEDHWLPGGDEAEMVDSFKECIPLIHDTLWSATALDIEFTLNRVIQRVLKDMSVERSVRQQRARALMCLGDILQEPMKEQKAQSSKAAPAAVEARTDGSSSPPRSTVATTVPLPDTASTGSTTSKRSMLTRLKSRGHTFFRPSSDRKEKEAEEAQKQENKRQKLEAALAMMAAGATTDEVDEMLRMRAQMEAEHLTA